MTDAERFEKALLLACHYQNLYEHLKEIIELFCMDAESK